MKGLIYIDRSNPRFKPRLDRALAIIDSTLDKESIQEVWLFGSLARGEARLTSDIDIMVSMRERIPEQDVRNRLYSLICDEDEKGLKVDLRFCIGQEVGSYSDMFNKEVLKDREVLVRYG